MRNYIESSVSWLDCKYLRMRLLIFLKKKIVTFLPDVDTLEVCRHGDVVAATDVMSKLLLVVGMDLVNSVLCLVDSADEWSPSHDWKVHVAIVRSHFVDLDFVDGTFLASEQHTPWFQVEMLSHVSEIRHIQRCSRSSLSMKVGMLWHSIALSIHSWI